MRHATLYRYSLPMEAGVILRNQRLKTRDGLLVRLQEGEKQGWGEIAPLPLFSVETLDEAQVSAQQWLSDWCSGKQPEESLLPSVAFGLSCAHAELQDELPHTADYRKAPLCNGDPDELFQRLAALPADAVSGLKVAKVKVGLYEAVRDGMVVNLLLEALPELTLRLDANRSWTPIKAAGFAKYVNPAWRSRIAFLEEPCRTPEESLAFAKETGIAIAWDETAREPDFVLQALPEVKALVIKPTLTGSLATCRSRIQQAHELGLQVVISSSIESSLGLTQLARLAHWLTPGTVPGLDTLNLMQQQLLREWPDADLPLLGVEALDTVWQA